VAGLHPDARLYRAAANNVIFENLHNSVMVDRASNNLVIKNPEGRVLSSSALTAVGAGAAGAAIGATLPHFIAKKACRRSAQTLAAADGRFRAGRARKAASRLECAPGAHEAQPTPSGPAPHETKPTQRARRLIKRSRRPSARRRLPLPRAAGSPARKAPAPGTAAPSHERTQEHGRGAPPGAERPGGAPGAGQSWIAAAKAARAWAGGPSRACSVRSGGAPPAPPPARAPTAPAAAPRASSRACSDRPGAPKKPHCEMENGKQVCR